MNWESYAHAEIKKRIFSALDKNLDYRQKPVLGLPATYLDSEVFYDNAPFLKDAPFLSTLISNPNHIGCHTLGDSEPAFEGTQAIENELIQLCSKEIFKGKDEAYDGYVASGGTEANIQAIWILKNYFIQALGATKDEIALVYSQDAHYSMPKAASLLEIERIVLPVEPLTRKILLNESHDLITENSKEGFKYFIVVLNMATTMFGSVDNIDELSAIFDATRVNYKIHIDGAYGGFIYPFTNPSSKLTFQHPKINSFTLDGHKMLQSPYGTGIYLTRKGFMQYALTDEANYVKGKDYTLVGSRSGANAIAVWMIMRTYGSEGWKLKVRKLVEKTNRLCEKLDDLGIDYYRNPDMNIVTLKAEHIPAELSKKYMLVPDTHDGKANWLKIVIMEHVTQGLLDQFIIDLESSLSLRVNNIIQSAVTQ